MEEKAVVATDVPEMLRWRQRMTLQMVVVLKFAKSDRAEQVENEDRCHRTQHNGNLQERFAKGILTLTWVLSMYKYMSTSVLAVPDIKLLVTMVPHDIM